jgi:glucose/arabinose dehydrogenase
MNRSRIACAAALTLALAPLGAGTASAARRPQGPPPPPKATGGKKVTTVAQGVPTPTQFAFGRGTVFVAGAGAEDGSAPGGSYTLKGGRATRVKGSPRMVFGLAFSGGTLYASSGPTIVAARGWNGRSFAGGFKTIFTGPKGFTGFNGIAIGPDGLIYAGVSMAEKGDSKKVDAPFAQSIVTLTTDGRDLRSYATGLRQPWMLTFAPGADTPLATALGQENLGRKQPPDYVIAPADGDDYGFPSCNWSKPDACADFARPLSLLPAHSSPMGIGVIGQKVYLALFTGTGRGPQVVSVPLAGGDKTTPLLNGFAAPVVALGTNGGWVYAGDVTGAIYRVKG